MNFEIVTCANDDRESDLRYLLRSIRLRLPTVPVRVIPFVGKADEVAAVAAEYGARMEEADPFWDALGRRVYGEECYRPISPSWTYFRKLNMFNGAALPRLYLDANCLLLSAEPGIAGVLGEKADVVFHSGASHGRNFDERFSGYVEAIVPEGFSVTGYNLAHCAFTPEAARRVRTFAEAVGGNIRPALGKAPEQAFLSYALLHVGLRTRLLGELVEGIAPTNSAKFALATTPDGAFAYTRGPYAGKTIVTVKKPAPRRVPSHGYNDILPLALGEA